MCHIKGMYLIELGQRIRSRRLERKISQQQLAAMVGLSRESISRLESGTLNDLGIKKVIAIADALGMQLAIEPGERRARPDFIARAVSAANLSLREHLYADELVQALLTGRVPPGRDAHLQAVFEELSPSNLEGLVEQVVALSGQDARVRESCGRLRQRLVPWQ